MALIGTKMTGNQYRNSKVDKVIFGVGAFENHGYHMPFGTDALISNILSEKLAERVEGLMVLPPINYGLSEHYNKFPFTVSLTPETITNVIKDILNEIVRNGITKIIIMNGHDGNIAPIELAARAVKVQHPHVTIASLNDWWVAAGKMVPEGTFEVWNGLGHAGEGETSMGLALFEDWMEMEHAKGVVPELPEFVEIKWRFEELTDTGASGDPSVATKEKGKLLEEAVLNVLENFIREMDKKDWKYGLNN
ncbi:MAG: creatininase family protein [Paenibacillus sp.]|uniref:Creatininase family protein n=1 Tax=Paenibacillus timonensis TaxID=225915 RepID=A0ABW3SCH8_9BACL|nr:MULTISPECIES: creatininase family protein [Paenibacillus]MCH1640268.1 creatininase family protein [Paenibacillus timonensis]MDU4697217.1 creatininase family protein [Paenibacillus sp.]